jgi:hypothetical protein
VNKCRESSRDAGITGVMLARMSDEDVVVVACGVWFVSRLVR